MSPSKTLPQFLSIYSSSGRKLPIPPEKCFLKISFFRSRKEGDYGVKILIEIKLTRVLVTSLDKFHHIYNLYSLASSMLNLSNKFFTKNIVCKNNYMKHTALLYPIFQPLHHHLPNQIFILVYIFPIF